MSRECFGCRIWPEDRGRCEAISGRWDQHHLLPKQIIRRAFPLGAVLTWAETQDGRGIWRRLERGEQADAPVTKLEELLADERNLVWVRRWHHDQVERRMRIVPFERLPLPAVVFARELGLDVHLERLYPPAHARMHRTPEGSE